jgi:hypothetical protein
MKKGRYLTSDEIMDVVGVIGDFRLSRDNSFYQIDDIVLSQHRNLAIAEMRECLIYDASIIPKLKERLRASFIQSLAEPYIANSTNDALAVAAPIGQSILNIVHSSNGGRINTQSIHELLNCTKNRDHEYTLFGLRTNAPELLDDFIFLLAEEPEFLRTKYQYITHDMCHEFGLENTFPNFCDLMVRNTDGSYVFLIESATLPWAFGDYETEEETNAANMFHECIKLSNAKMYSRNIDGYAVVSEIRNLLATDFAKKTKTSANHVSLNVIYVDDEYTYISIASGDATFAPILTYELIKYDREHTNYANFEIVVTDVHSIINRWELITGDTYFSPTENVHLCEAFYPDSETPNDDDHKFADNTYIVSLTNNIQTVSHSALLALLVYLGFEIHGYITDIGDQIIAFVVHWPIAHRGGMLESDFIPSAIAKLSPSDYIKQVYEKVSDAFLEDLDTKIPLSWRDRRLQNKRYIIYSLFRSYKILLYGTTSRNYHQSHGRDEETYVYYDRSIFANTKVDTNSIYTNNFQFNFITNGMFATERLLKHEWVKYISIDGDVGSPNINILTEFVTRKGTELNGISQGIGGELDGAIARDPVGHIKRGAAHSKNRTISSARVAILFGTNPPQYGQTSVKLAVDLDVSKKILKEYNMELTVSDITKYKDILSEVPERIRPEHIPSSVEMSTVKSYLDSLLD